MLKLMSDNTPQSKIHSLSFTRIALNRAENADLLSSHPNDQLVQVDQDYKVRIGTEEPIEDGLRPSLKKNITGPFRLAIHTTGPNIAQSIISFDIEPIAPTEVRSESGDIIISDEFTLKSIAVIPFLEIFGKQIEREAQRANELIRKARQDASPNVNYSFAETHAKQEAEILFNAAANIMNALYPNGKAEINEPTVMGKEAIADNLASSLAASNAFYITLWHQMDEFFTPAYRYIGEQAALGNTALTSSLKL